MNYRTRKWEKKRAHILRLDRYIDRVAKRYGKTIEANLVHHIYPADEYPEYAWQDWNLISVSVSTHQKLHDRNTGKLTALGVELQERTVPGKDWRRHG